MAHRCTHLSPEDREARNARVRDLYAKIAAESGRLEAVRAIAARFSISKDTVRAITTKKEQLA